MFKVFVCLLACLLVWLVLLASTAPAKSFLSFTFFTSFFHNFLVDLCRILLNAVIVSVRFVALTFCRRNLLSFSSSAFWNLEWNQRKWVCDNSVN